MTTGEQIVKDRAGFFRSHERYTHYPSGDTIVKQPHEEREAWEDRKQAFFRRHPSARVFDEHGDPIARRERF